MNVLPFPFSDSTDTFHCSELRFRGRSQVPNRQNQAYGIAVLDLYEFFEDTLAVFGCNADAGISHRHDERNLRCVQFAETATVPPEGVYFSAFESRFVRMLVRCSRVISKRPSGARSSVRCTLRSLYCGCSERTSCCDRLGNIEFFCAFARPRAFESRKHQQIANELRKTPCIVLGGLDDLFLLCVYGPTVHPPEYRATSSSMSMASGIHVRPSR